VPANYDAVLVVSFGGPEKRDDVMPFLERVVAGRNVPRERLLSVAEHYYELGGKSPINDQVRALIAALVNQLNSRGPRLPVYWGNRNWHPLLADTLRSMAEDGIRRAVAFFTSPYSSYSSCRQYREDIAAAREEVGPEAPEIDKLRCYYNHPGFIEPMADRVREALIQISPERRAKTQILYSAHSIPLGMAENCRYEEQLRESSRLVSHDVGHDRWRLVYQSRSGPPSQLWLEPDVCDVLRELKEQSDVEDVVIAPIGFISDHMEVVYDLDHEARDIAEKLGLNLVRAKTVGTHPRFVEMIRELIEERVTGADERPALGDFGPSHDVCPTDCCLYTPRRPAPA